MTRDPGRLRVGITLPQFRQDADAAIAVAREADEVGIDGVFVFDHIWPLGSPDRPALHSLTLLGALTAETSRVSLGTLVARVGLLPDAVLVHAMVTLARMAGPRLIAGLGTGDSANRKENLAYGVPFPPKDERVARLGRCLDLLRNEGITTWAGGNSPEVRAIARAHADGWNSWSTDVATFEAYASEPGVMCTWGGQVLIGADPADAAARLARHGQRPGLIHGSVAEVGTRLRALHQAGASWVVCAPLDIGISPDAVRLVADAAARARG